jgi:hypothetical protein
MTVIVTGEKLDDVLREARIAVAANTTSDEALREMYAVEERRLGAPLEHIIAMLNSHCEVNDHGNFVYTKGETTHTLTVEFPAAYASTLRIDADVPTSVEAALTQHLVNDLVLKMLDTMESTYMTFPTYVRSGWRTREDPSPMYYHAMATGRVSA